jgi:hypothetical protein
MKTNSTINQPTSVDSILGNKGSSRLAKLSRLLMAVLGVSLVSATVPSALAAIPNGDYGFISATGSVKYDGNTITLSPSAIKRIAGVVNDKITIENSTLPLNRSATKKVIRTLADDLNFDASYRVTGPTSIVLAKEGDIFIGTTAEPIVVAFDGNFQGEEFSGSLNSDISAKVKGKTLRVTITFSGDALGSEFSGKLVIVAKR